MIRKNINNYTRACFNIAHEFCEKYDLGGITHDDFIGEDPTGILFLDEFCFDISFMYTALLHNATWEQIHDYYWGDFQCNFENYVKYGGNKPITEEEKRELEKRVTEAEKDFMDYLKKSIDTGNGY